MRETWIQSMGWEGPLEKGYPLQCSGLENFMECISLWGCKSYPLQYSGLENSMDWMVHGVAKSWTWLSDFYFHFNVTERIVGSPAAHCLRGNKQARLVERKVCFISDACNCGGRVVDIHPKADFPYPHNQWGKRFYRPKSGWGTTCGNSKVISDSRLQLGHRWSD